MFIPAHITGFFTIHRDREILKTGSTGAGLTLNRGVRVKIKEGSGRIYFNSEKVNICPVKKILPKDLDVYIESDFPLGSGLGISGASTLGLSKLIYKDYLKKAHEAEVLCSTGLGDVIAQEVRGFVVRLKPGLPLKVIKIYEDSYVIVDILGKKETKDIINNKTCMEKINNVGRKCLNELLKNLNIKNFLSLSYTFAKETGLIDEEIDELCRYIKYSSQSMLGKTFFCVCSEKEVDDIASILNNPIVCKVKN
ncbi:pantoate kinase [Methanocaldococcus sp.]